MAKTSFLTPVFNSDLFPHLNKALNNLSLWFNKNQRALPFRKEKSVYGTWVSEVMLQQTTINTVTPYYNRFMEKFPTIYDLAKSPLEEVLKLWSGLGYYSRAKNLHACAIHVVNHHSGKFPKTIKDLLTLPGIGAYTAGAILSIGYNIPTPIVDANIIRVFSRLRILPISSNNKKEWYLANLLVHYANIIGISPYIFNQALMELGALVCTPKNPTCNTCPLNSICKIIKKEINPNLYPILPEKKEKVVVKEDCLLITKKENRDSYIFIIKDPNKKWLKDLWDLPISDSLPFIKKKFPLFKINYTITHHGIIRHLFSVKENYIEIESYFSNKNILFQWVKINELIKTDKIAATSALKKVAKTVKSLENPIFGDTLYT